MSFIEFYHLIRTERSDLLGQNSCRVFKWFNQSQIRAPPVTNTVINTFPGVYKKNPQRTRPSCEVQPDLWQHAKDSTTDQSADHQQPEDQVCCRGGRHVQWIQTSSGEDLKKTALNRRQCKNRVAFAKVHSLWKGWTVEKWQKTFFFFFWWIIHWTAFPLPQILQKTCWNLQGSKIHPENRQVWWW